MLAESEPILAAEEPQVQKKWCSRAGLLLTAAAAALTIAGAAFVYTHKPPAIAEVPELEMPETAARMMAGEEEGERFIIDKIKGLFGGEPTLMPVQRFPEYSYSNCEESDGGITLAYLDRHNVACEGQPVTEWEYIRAGCPWGKHRIKYHCGIWGDEDYPTSNDQNVIELTTQCGYAKTLEDLKAFDVMCPADRVLTGWRFERGPCSRHDDNLEETHRFRYQCAMIDASTAEVDERFGTCEQAHGVGVIFLDRHHVQCRPGFAIQGWRFRREQCNPEHYRFLWRCIKAKSDK